MSEGKSYGKRQPRYYRLLKQIFKMASHIVTQEACNNSLKEFNEYLIKEKQKSPQIARHNIADKIGCFGLWSFKDRGNI